MSQLKFIQIQLNFSDSNEWVTESFIQTIHSKNTFIQKKEHWITESLNCSLHQFVQTHLFIQEWSIDLLDNMICLGTTPVTFYITLLCINLLYKQILNLHVDGLIIAMFGSLIHFTDLIIES